MSMRGHGAKYPRKKEEAIAALLTNPSVEKAAQSIGVDVKTLRKWMREPDFEEDYRLARREHTAQVTARYEQACMPAWATLVKMLSQESKASDSSKMRAAASIVRFTKHAETLEELNAQVTKIEQQQRAAASSPSSGSRGSADHGAKKPRGLRTRKQEEAIAALLRHPTVEAAAQAIGISPKTLQHWMRTPDFEEAYRKARWAKFSEVLAWFQHAYSIAVNFLMSLLNQESAQPAAQRAAEFVLEQRAQNALNDLRGRVQRLRSQQGNNSNVGEGEEYRNVA